MTTFTSELNSHTTILYTFQYHKNEIPDNLFKGIYPTLPVEYSSHYTALSISEDLISEDIYTLIKKYPHHIYDVKRHTSHGNLLQYLFHTYSDSLLDYANFIPGALRNIKITFILIEIDLTSNSIFIDNCEKMKNLLYEKMNEFLDKNNILSEEERKFCRKEIVSTLQCNNIVHEKDKKYFTFYNIEEVINGKSVSKNLHKKK